MPKNTSFISLSAPEKYIRRKYQQEGNHSYRNEFMRDRDKILYSKAFRRLSGKTQIFLTKIDDHRRTRLTHTLEVAQIARTISANLQLNDDLTEAIALGHDVGHTPFGHIGERVLNLIMNGCEEFTCFINKDENKGFKHNLQGIRVLTKIEKSIYGDNKSLNLTNFTLYGIFHHTSAKWENRCPYCDEKNSECKIKIYRPKNCACSGQLSTNFYTDNCEYLKIEELGIDAVSLEAQVVKLSDEIAQRHHDLEDAILAKIMTPGEVCELLKNTFSDLNFLSFKRKNYKTIFNNNLKNMEKQINGMYFVPYMSRLIVDLYVTQLLANSMEKIKKFTENHQIDRKGFVEKFGELSEGITELVSFSEEFVEKDKQIRNFLKNRVLNSFEVQRMDGKGAFIIRKLFRAYLANPQQLPDDVILQIYSDCQGSPIQINSIEDFKKEVGEKRNQLDRDKSTNENDFLNCLCRNICDFIAGMTDNYALEEYKKLYI